MSKREIPEINAGSMADIAFLLLIFFLVTTTMDRDTAYVRRIPKKVEVKEPPVPIEERNILAIKANSRNQLMVRGEIIDNPDNISDKVIEFYRKNEKENDPTNNFPMYSRTSMTKIETELEKAIENYEREEQIPDVDPDILTFRQTQIDEWQKKKDALKLYRGQVLPEIQFQANIRIEVQIATAYELFAKIQTEIEEAIFELRDTESKRIFGESYGTIRARFAQDQEPMDEKKLDLLEILYPARIIEVTPKK